MDLSQINAEHTYSAVLTSKVGVLTCLVFNSVPFPSHPPSDDS